MDSPLFSPCFFGKSPCPAWTLPDRGFPCYRLPHAGDRASKVRCFYFFVLNAAIRMTISNSTAPTSIIPKPSDMSHIQMVAAQTIFRFPSFLTLLISLSLGAGTAWCRWRGSNPHGNALKALILLDFLFRRVIIRGIIICTGIFHRQAARRCETQSRRLRHRAFCSSCADRHD